MLALVQAPGYQFLCITDQIGPNSSSTGKECQLFWYVDRYAVKLPDAIVVVVVPFKKTKTKTMTMTMTMTLNKAT